jgi:hypothetical protein
MPLIPAQKRSSAWKRAARFVAILSLLLAAVGFIFDLFSGLPLLRSSRSWLAWLVGVMALGALYLLGEGAGDWINARDKVSHPLWRRVWHLALLLGMVALVAIAAGEIIRMAQ